MTKLSTCINIMHYFNSSMYASHCPLSLFEECCFHQRTLFCSRRMKCFEILPLFFCYHHMSRLKLDVLTFTSVTNSLPRL
jgi:hypothetical protein